MEIVENKVWLSKMNKLSANVLMPVMAGTFVLFNTVVNLWVGERIETIQNVLAILILGTFLCNVLANPKKNIVLWMKENIFIVLYFVVRFISLWQSNFDYSVIRTIFFELFFLIGINIFVTEKKKKVYIIIFVIPQLIFSFFSLLGYYLIPFFNEEIYTFLWYNSYLRFSENAIFFSNPNAAGIMSAFAIVITIICYKLKLFEKKLCIGYGIYNCITLIMFGCRSAEVAIIGVLALLLLKRIVPKLTPKVITSVVLCIMVLITLGIMLLLTFGGEQETFKLNKTEEIINNVSTGRYAIWKDCYIAQEEKWLFGKGSLKIEQEDRQNLHAELKLEENYIFADTAKYGPHNGYISIIICAGIIGFVLFVIVLLEKIRKSQMLSKNEWYLIVLFVLIVNCFESLLIVNRFFICFYMFLILAMDSNGDKLLYSISCFD